MKKLLMLISSVFLAGMVLAQEEKEAAPLPMSCSCSSFFGLSRCDVTCPPPGGAACLTIYGFCQCFCVSVGGSASAGSRVGQESTILASNLQDYLAFLQRNIPGREQAVRSELTKYLDLTKTRDYVVDADRFSNLVNDYKKLIDSFSEQERAIIEAYFKSGQ